MLYVNALLPAQTIVSTRRHSSLTLAADLASASCSSAESLSCTISSTPRRPSFTGTPTKSPFTPYSTGLARNTVRKVLRGEHLLKVQALPRASKLDPFKTYLKERFGQYQLSAVRLLAEIQPMGYTGSVVTIGRYLETLKGPEQRLRRITVR